MSPAVTRPAALWRCWRLLFVLALGLVAAGLAGRELLPCYHWRAALGALQRYHVGEARAHLAPCVRAWPRSRTVRLLASRAARLAGDFEEAEQHLEACEDLEKTRADETVLERALLRAAGGDFDDDLEAYLQDRAEKDLGHAPLIYEALAEGYARLYRHLDAFGCLDRWLLLEPDCPQALFLRGETYRQAKALQKAVPEYRRVVELDPQRDDARRWLTAGLVEVGRYEEALGHLEYLRRRDPDDPVLVVRVARCHSGLGRTEQAVRLLDGLLARRPHDGQALKARGEVALTAGAAAEAEPWLRAAGRELPYDYQVQWSLCQCLRQQGKDAEAKAELARAQQLEDRIARLNELSSRKLAASPHDPALYCEFGTLLLDLGHREMGERWLLTALREDPNYRPAHLALAAYYEKQGDRQKAAEHQQLAAADPR
jgi:predicted Zn-dependent protease